MFQFPDPKDSDFEFETNEMFRPNPKPLKQMGASHRGKCEALPSIQASQKVKRKLDRGNSASSVKSAPVSLKDSVHQELIAKANSSHVL